MHTPLPVFRGPYVGGYSGAFWNAQVAYAADVSRQTPKQRYVTPLIKKRDFVGLAETHNTTGKDTTAFKRPGVSAFWAHGTNSTAGIGLLVRDSFLRNFNPTVEGAWSIICPGRIGRLRLEGAQGCLDIYVLYLTTGNSSSDREDRAGQARLFSQHLASQDARLSLVMGDFNFVSSREDRVNTTNGQRTGSGDLTGKDWFEETSWRPNGFHELRQPHFTHQNGLARSRLDRVYSNHFLPDQLDRYYSCYTLPMPPHLSAHVAIAFERRRPRDVGPKSDVISNATVQHP